MTGDPTNGPLVAVLLDSGTLENGDALVREGRLTAPWNTEETGVAQIGLRSDSTHGPLIGVVAGARRS